jgi:hypothetical protein
LFELILKHCICFGEVRQYYDGFKGIDDDVKNWKPSAEDEDFRR